jgi:hypothetical protein
MLAAIPVTIVPAQTDWSSFSKSVADRSEFAVGAKLIKSNGAWSMTLYSIARFALLPFAILGILLVWRWSTVVTSTTAGVMAVGLYCCSPTVLANGSMITPDLGSAVLGGWAWWTVRTWLKSGSWADAVACGLLLGLALLTKFTCGLFALLLPVFAVAHRVDALCITGKITPPDSGSSGFLRRTVPQICLTACVAFYVVNSGYGFDGTGTKLGDFSFYSDALKGDAEHHGNVFAGTSWSSVPVPFPKCFVEGIDVQKRDFDRGYRSYLMGEWKQGGWWYYYLVGFLVKEPIGFQLMLYVSILHGLWSWKRWTGDTVREWSLIVLPPVLIFALVSSQTGFNHHLRYVLPAYPFLLIIAARTVTLGRFWKWFSCVCLTWQVCAVLWFAPHWMSYFNEAAGGPLRGHEWLVDSNIDWGQDLLMLKWWQDQHPEAADLQAALFTGFDPRDIGLKFRLPAPFVAGEPQIISPDGLRGPQPGWYAISVCQLKGHSFSVPTGDGSWNWSNGHFTYFLKHLEPVDRIGYSIYIYHITEAQAAEVRELMLQQEQAAEQEGYPP